MICCVIYWHVNLMSLCPYFEVFMCEMKWSIFHCKIWIFLILYLSKNESIYFSYLSYLNIITSISACTIKLNKIRWYMCNNNYLWCQFEKNVIGCELPLGNPIYNIRPFQKERKIFLNYYIGRRWCVWP